MHDLLIQLQTYIRGVWRYRWWALSVAWLVSSVGWLVVAKLPDQYDATARVYVDTQNLLKPLLKGLAVTSNERQRLLLMSKTLLSHPNLQKVMRMTDLDLRAKDAKDTDDIINELKKRISLKSTRDVNLYTISYTDEDPKLAKLVVKSLLTIFVESNLGESRKEQDSARRFLEQQIAVYQRRLEEAEARQAEFKQKNLQYLSEESGGYYAQLRENRSRLTEAELELQVQKDRLAALQEQMDEAEGEESLYDELLGGSSSGGGTMASSYDARIAALEANLDDLLMRYTDKHPDVIGSRRTLAELKRKRKKELASKVGAGNEGESAGSNNPVYQQLRLTYADAKAEVAAKQAIVDEYKKRIARLEGEVDKVLQVEAEAKQLNRDYGIMRKQHQSLLARLESANMTRDVDASANTVRFRIIDPPRVPNKPSGPPRLLYSTLVLLLGLAAGILVALIISQFRPTFDDRRTLNEATGIPVIGSVSMVWTDDQRRVRRRRHLAFMMGLLSLFSVYALVSVAYLRQVDWISYLDEVKRIAGL